MLNIKEIFFSYQSEGIYIGSPTVFIRFAGCNYRCYYCDTKSALVVKPKYKISVEETIDKVIKLINKHNPYFVSLTGGEPLLQKNLPVFVKLLREKCKNKTIKIYLETNASLYLPFKKIVDFIDVCAINLKLSVDDKINRVNMDIVQNQKEVQKIIKLCKTKHKEWFLKLVVTKNCYDAQIIKSLEKFLKLVKPKVLVIQPETKSFKKNNKNLYMNICNIFNTCKTFIPYVFVIPQLHKFLWKIK